MGVIDYRRPLERKARSEAFTRIYRRIKPLARKIHLPTPYIRGATLSIWH